MREIPPCKAPKEHPDPQPQAELKGCCGSSKWGWKHEAWQRSLPRAACAPCGARWPGREVVTGLGEVFLCITGGCLGGTTPDLTTYAL